MEANDNSPQDVLTYTVVLSSSLTEEQASIVAESLDDMAMATTVLRKDDRHKGPWQIQWYLASVKNADVINERLDRIANETGFDIEKGALEKVDTEKDWLAYSYEGTSKNRPLSGCPS